MKLTRDFYIPKGSTKVSDKASDAVAYIYANKSGSPCAAIFLGKQAKPIGNYRYRNDAERAKHIEQQFNYRRQHAEHLAKYREERKGKHSLVVGQVLRSSWGYDQTNIDWYQVTKLIGDHTVEIRKIKADTVEKGWLTGDCLPREDDFSGEPMRKRANHNNSVKVRDWGVWAYPWDGRAERWSAYA